MATLLWLVRCGYRLAGATGENSERRRREMVLLLAWRVMVRAFVVGVTLVAVMTALRDTCGRNRRAWRRLLLGADDWRGALLGLVLFSCC